MFFAYWGESDNLALVPIRMGKNRFCTRTETSSGEKYYSKFGHTKVKGGPAVGK